MLAVVTLLHPSYNRVPLSTQVYLASGLSLSITDKNISITTCFYNRIFLTFVGNMMVVSYFIASTLYSIGEVTIDGRIFSYLITLYKLYWLFSVLSGDGSNKARSVQFCLAVRHVSSRPKAGIEKSE
jgi:hypothetical protein